MHFRQFARGLLLLVNTIFITASLAAVIGGALIYAIGDQYNLTPTVALGLIGIAIFSGFISIHGFIASLKRSRVGLWIYFGLLLFVLGCQIAVIIITFIFKSYTEDILNRLWHTELSDQSKNLLQYNFNCCGYLNSLDSPGSSCPIDIESGCRESIGALLSQYSTYIYIGGFVLLSLEVLIILIIILMNTVYYINDRIDIEFETLNRPPTVQVKDLTIFETVNIKDTINTSPPQSVS